MRIETRNGYEIRKGTWVEYMTTVQSYGSYREQRFARSVKKDMNQELKKRIRDNEQAEEDEDEEDEYEEGKYDSAMED
jgi:hypothetical protein